jgi:signal transduction histidine kinase
MVHEAHILLVDDDSALLQALLHTLQLRMTGIAIDTCSEAQTALELISQNDYDAIISDIKMPGMDGLELLQQIKKVRATTPTILITGHGEQDLAIQALRGGAYDYIQKPIDRDVIVASLQRAIESHRLHRQVLAQQIALAQHANILEYQVLKRTNKLNEANQTKEKLFSIVAHELKQPLSNLKGMTQLLQQQVGKQASTESIEQGLQEMEHALGRTELLVQDLLDTSLIETNMFVLHRHKQDLVTLCQRLLQEYTAGSAGPRLTSEARGNTLEAEIDENRLGQVLLNLLSNARKYSRRGTTITVRVQRVGYQALISIQDQGIGIAQEEQEQIFKQFYRVPGVEPQTGSKPGVGLGLYIAHKIIERHGGEISVESILGEGSVFTVFLPVSIGETTTNEVTSSELHTAATWTLAH